MRPLSLLLELQDLTFLVECLKYLPDNVDLSAYLHAGIISASTRAGSTARKFPKRSRTSKTTTIGLHDYAWN